MCLEDPDLAHALLRKYTDALCVYASYQIESGAQILQIFESWAHQLSEEQFVQFAKPYADEVAKYLKARHPSVPVVRSIEVLVLPAGVTHLLLINILSLISFCIPSHQTNISLFNRPMNQ